MSIQFRLNLAIAVLSALGLLCMIGFILIDARPRMDVENASTMLLTETLIRSSLVPLRESNDPKQALARLIAELKPLRHASVSLASQTHGEDSGLENAIEKTWLSRWKDLPISPVRIPVEVGDHIIDTILITPRPDDELSELLEAIFRIFQWGTIVSAVLLLLTWLITRRSLAPVHALRDAMHRMSAGEFNLRVPETGPPEIKSICASLNALASALQDAQRDNLSLTANMILIQDEERRDIARELHDELGPHMFAMRTDASLVAREFDKTEVDFSRVRRLNSQILGHIDLLQQTNRRVLERLAPPGLAELGLAGALRALTEMWKRTKSGVELEVTISGQTERLDKMRTLTIYRVVQEGLTNAFRHSEASSIRASVGLHGGQGTSDTEGSTDLVEIVVQDNGVGVRPAKGEGFGLKAMRERVTALAGSLTLETVAADKAGSVLRVSFPACDQAAR